MPNCSATAREAWFGSMTPPDPIRRVVVTEARCAMSTAGAELAIPGRLWCSATQCRPYPNRSTCWARSMEFRSAAAAIVPAGTGARSSTDSAVEGAVMRVIYSRAETLRLGDSVRHRMAPSRANPRPGGHEYQIVPVSDLVDRRRSEVCGPTGFRDPSRLGPLRRGSSAWEDVRQPCSTRLFSLARLSSASACRSRPAMRP